MFEVFHILHTVTDLIDKVQSEPKINPKTKTGLHALLKRLQKRYLELWSPSGHYTAEQKFYLFTELERMLSETNGFIKSAKTLKCFDLMRQFQHLQGMIKNSRVYKEMKEVGPKMVRLENHRFNEWQRVQVFVPELNRSISLDDEEDYTIQHGKKVYPYDFGQSPRFNRLLATTIAEAKRNLIASPPLGL